MFDDKPINQKADGSVPQNLPVSEPEDIFASSSPTPQEQQPPESNTFLPSESPTALDAGALKPVAAEMITPRPATTPAINPQSAPSLIDSAEPVRFPQAPPAPSMDSPSPTQPMGSVMPHQEPHAARGVLVVILIIVALVILIGGSLWLYFSFIRTDDTSLTQPIITPISEQVIEDTDLEPEPVEEEVIEDESQDTSDEDIDNVLFGETPEQDIDGDGLSDMEETNNSTDPENWDTDGDLLSDGDEVLIWKSDPLNPDTDNDGFEDGAEVKNGYSPTGPEQIFQPPSSVNAESESSVTTSTGSGDTTSPAL